MTKLTELKIEEFIIELLIEQGYEHIHAPNASDSNDGSFRNSFDDVLLENKLRSAILRINPNIDEKTQDEVLGIVKRVDSSEVISGNESFYSMMTNGVNIIIRRSNMAYSRVR